MQTQALYAIILHSMKATTHLTHINLPKVVGAEAATKGYLASIEPGKQQLVDISTFACRPIVPLTVLPDEQPQL